MPKGVRTREPLKTAPATSREGKNGQSYAACRGCDRRWSGLREAHCSACHRHFSSPYTFDAHRQRGKCLDPRRLRIKGRRLKITERASGPVWVLDLDDVYQEDAA